MEKNTSVFNEKCKSNYDENSNNGYIFEADVEYLKKLYELYNDLPLLPERKKIKIFCKLVCNLYDKENYVAHMDYVPPKH